MLRTMLILHVLVLAACAAKYAEIAPGVVLLQQQPTCDYERLGQVVAHSGRTDRIRQNRQNGAGAFEVWGERPNSKSVLADLREQAQRKGANAVVIRSRQVSVERAAGTSAIRPDEGLRISGIAIRTSFAPTSDQCGRPALFSPG